jgi:archaetidylinositol phosphate synthase
MHPWRERLARWFTPLARRMPLSPNAITLIAFALNVIASACLVYGALRPVLFLVAIVIIGISGLLDALDGIVARVQNKSSRFGDFLDHCADRAGDTLLAACWLVGNNVRQPLAMAGIIMTMLNGYIGTQIEATYGERSYESIGRGEFVLGIIVLPIVSYILFTNGWESLRFASLTVAEWLAVVMLAFALFGVVQRFRVAARLERS